MHSLAMEGDFIETDDGLIFDVKGFLHPNDRKIAYLRYIPASFFNPDYKNAKKKEIKEIKSGIEEKFQISVADVRFGKEMYIKLYDIPSRFIILSHFKPEYIYNSNLYDFPLQSVPIQDIKAIHAPEFFLKKKLELKEDTTLLNLVNFIRNGSKVPISHIGLTGSSLVGLEGKTSDYDIIVYGEKESINTHSFLDEKFSHSKRFTSEGSEIHAYDELSLKKHYKTRASGFNISYMDFFNTERKKTHQFLIDDKEVFIRFIKFYRPKAILPQFDDYSFINLGRVALTGIIIDDSKSFFTPGRYALKITDITSDKGQFTENPIEIFTLRGRFLEQARNGDTVSIQGKLEQINELSTHNSSQRIVIGTNPDDLMIQMNRSSEKFN
jgi:predicted nucleotidyltransferase